MGRPSKYTERLAKKICNRLSNGEGLAGICRESNMPAQATIMRWLRANNEFREMYTRAREDQAEVMADQITDIADSADREDAQVAKLRVDARKWVAAKLLPRKYGDVTRLEGNLTVNLADVVGRLNERGQDEG